MNFDKILATVLVAACLSAQWAGLQHRIAHGRLGSRQVPEAAAADSVKQGHSCILFDAAALTAGATNPPFVVPVLPPHPEDITTLPWRSWLAPFAWRFAARAPPYAS